MTMTCTSYTSLPVAAVAVSYAFSKLRSKGDKSRAGAKLEIDVEFDAPAKVPMDRLLMLAALLAMVVLVVVLFAKSYKRGQPLALPQPEPQHNDTANRGVTPLQAVEQSGSAPALEA